MATASKVLVIGGGIVGLSTALSLQGRGVAVTVLDDAPARPPASFGNIGHIAIEQTAPLASLANLASLPRRLAAFGGPVSFPLAGIGQWLPFGLRLMARSSPDRFARGKAALTALLDAALPAWRARVEQIGRPDLLRETGHLVVWESAETAARGRGAALDAARPGLSVQDASRDDLALLDAVLRRPLAGAVRYRGSASVADPGLVLEAMRAALRRDGGRLETGLARPDRLADPAFDAVVVAAGVRSAQLLTALGHKVPMIAERGYHLQASPTAAWPAGLPPIVFEDRSLVVSGFASGLRATSFVEFTRHDAPPDPAKWRRIQRQVEALGLPFSGPLSTWYGSRPTLPDYLPAIGRTGRVTYACGHQHLGLTLGPLTGRLAAALVMGEPPEVDVGAFGLGRFG